MAVIYEYKTILKMEGRAADNTPIKLYIQKFVQDNWYVDVYEVRGNADPIEISWGGDYIVTAKGKITFKYDGSYDFSQLFTSDPFLYRVLIYEDTSLIFTGFLDTELYEAPLLSNAFDVTFHFNDGLAILKRLNTINVALNRFIPTSERDAVYSIDYFFRKLFETARIPYTYINYNINLISNQIPADINTIVQLANHYVNINNFYKNDGAFMNCWEMLEGILKSYGLRLLYYDNQIWISDLYSMAISDTYQRTQNGVVIDLYTYTGSHFVDIDKFSNARLSLIPAMNKFSIESDLYYKSKILDIKFSESTFSNWLITNNYADLPDYSYKAYEYDLDSQLININTANYQLIRWENTGTENKGKVFYYANIYKVGGTTANEAFKIKTPYINGSTDGRYLLKVKINCRIRTKDYPDADDITSPPTQINTIAISPIVKIGNYYYINSSARTIGRGVYGEWVETTQYYRAGATGTKLNDSNIDIIFYVHLNNSNLNGSLEMVFNNYVSAIKLENGTTRVDVTGNIKSFDINSIEIFIVDYLKPTYKNTTVLVDQDTIYRQNEIIDYEEVEIENNVYETDFDDAGWLNTEPKIKSIIGTNVYKLPVCAGGLLYWNGTNYVIIESFVMPPDSGLSNATLEENTLYYRYLQKKTPTRQINGQMFNVKLKDHVPFPPFSVSDSAGIKYYLADFNFKFYSQKLALTLVELKTA